MPGLAPPAGGSRRPAGLACLWRGAGVAEQPSPAPLRVALAADEQALAVRILKRRGRPASRSLCCRFPPPFSVPGDRRVLWLALHFPCLPIESLPLRQPPSAVVAQGRVWLGDAAAGEAGVCPARSWRPPLAWCPG
jgi:hypothetical protein